MIQEIAQNGQNLKYCIHAHCANWGKYKNFQCAIRAFWGNYKILGQNIHPCCQKIHLENSMKEKDINSCLYCFECGISESAQQNHQGCHKTQICPHCSKVLLLKPVQSHKVNFLYSTTKT